MEYLKHIPKRERRRAVPSASSLALAALSVTAAMPLAAARPAQAPDTAPISVLTVGGGPTRQANQVAIESNVRYVDRLLPSTRLKRILFADGQGMDATVQYRDEAPPLPDAERAFAILFGQRNENTALRYRKPRLPALNGASTRAGLTAALSEYVAEPADRQLLVYFTGHGNRNPQDNDNNTFALWGERGLTVRELSTELEKLPAARPVVVVMVQCFSGAFANLIFQGGVPTNDLTGRPICGFFATTRERVAAGCTPAVNEADYDDFTSYFFAGLTGTTRLGRKVPAPDYNKDGRVGMDEAFAYAVITEPSADVPVATSDVFLRRFVPVNDDDVVAVPFEEIRTKASPAQRASLEALSNSLGATGDDRLKIALQAVRQEMSVGGADHGHDGDASTSGPSAAAKLTELRASLTRQFPGLSGRRDAAAFGQARTAAIGYLSQRKADVDAALKAGEGMGKVAASRYQAQLRGARYLRLLRVAKSVVLEGRLRAGGDAALIARFDALKKLEAGNPLLPGKTAVARMQNGSGR